MRFSASRQTRVDRSSTAQLLAAGALAWFGLAGPTSPSELLQRLAVALLLAAVGEAVADAHAPVAGRAVQQDVGDGDRHLLGEPAALGVLLAGLQVLVDAVDPLDDDLVLLGQDPQDLARRPMPLSSPVITTTWSSLRIFMARLGPLRWGLAARWSAAGSDQTTSAARLMIFMNWRSRSSRAIAPKMRVPRGSSRCRSGRTALRSNLT